MYKGNSNRTASIIIIIVVMMAALTGLFFIGRALFFGEGKYSVEDPGRSALVETTSDMSVRITVRGAIVATEQFRSYTAEVSPNFRTLTTYSGYISSQLEQQSLSNNVPAYREFVNALSYVGIMDGRELTGDSNNTDGICASGTLYKFEVLRAGQPVKTLWKTTCGTGSFVGSIAAARKLFLLQFPDSQKITNSIKLQ